jgi:hypothetical protein
MTWAILIFSVLMLVWIIAGVASQPGLTAEDEAFCRTNGILSEEECRDSLEAAGDLGTGIGVALLIILWFFGFVILSIIWFMTRRRGRICPHCGEDVKKGRTTCKDCGYDFTLGGRPPAPAAPSA